MKIPIYHIDAFTDQLFKGNPAAVCPLERWLDKSIMQKIAFENGLSETAFFIKKGETYEIKWFSPKMEIDLCGHATLASAHVIFNHLENKTDKIILNSKSGELKVTKTDGFLTLDFPKREYTPFAVIPELLIEALRLKPIEAYRSVDILAVYNTEKEIETLHPDFDKLSKLDCRGIIVTAKGYVSDFVSRFFAPLTGINEDPVTGSAHTILTPFWAERLDKKILHALQLSPRQGELVCKMEGNRVLISGKAITYSKGEIEI